MPCKGGSLVLVFDLPVFFFVSFNPSLLCVCVCVLACLACFWRVCDVLGKVAGATTEKVVRVALAALKHLTEGEVRVVVWLGLGCETGLYVRFYYFAVLASLARDNFYFF